MAHKLSAYDKARQVLKANGIKTDAICTKASLIASLVRMKEPEYKKLGEELKASLTEKKPKAKKAKGEKKAKPAKKAKVTKGAEKVAKAKVRAAKVKAERAAEAPVEQAEAAAPAEM